MAQKSEESAPIPKPSPPKQSPASKSPKIVIKISDKSGDKSGDEDQTVEAVQSNAEGLESEGQAAVAASE